MLSKIRDTMGSTFVFGLLGILIASFALWGAGGAFVNSGGVVATVDSEPITAQELDRTFRNEVDRYREQLGGQFDTQRALAMGLPNQVLNQLVQKKALDNEAGSLGLLGSDHEVRAAIQGISAFQDLGGKFSRLAYDQQLMQVGMTTKEFEDQVRVDIARTQLIDAFTETALIPERLVDALYTFRKETRTARVATIPAGPADAIKPPGGEELHTYYDSIKEQLKTPELRDLRVLVLRPADFAAQMTFTEDELREEYERRADDFNVPERRQIDVAVLKTEADARELHERVTSGEDFTAVTQDMTGFAADEQSLGLVSQADLAQTYSAAAAEAAFATPAGGVTEPTSTLLGWQVFRVESLTPGVSRPFEQVQDNLKDSLAAEKGIDALYDAVGKLDDMVAAGAPFEQMVAETGLTPIAIPGVSADGRHTDGSPPANPLLLPFIQRAFTYEEGHGLDVEEIQGADTFYVVSVDRIIPPETLPFEKVEGDLTADWISREQMKAAGQRADAALKAFQGGASLEQVARSYGGTVFSIGPYARDRALFSRELPPELARLLFSLKQGEGGIEQDARGSGYLLIVPVTVTPGDPAANRAELLQIRGRILNDLKNDLFYQLEAAIEADQRISINQKAVDQLYQIDNSGFGPQP
jgi:peptidyl-prolyl cis-trans isomerase D